jgi:magnesium transporter
MSEVTKDIQKFAEEDLTPYFIDVQDQIEKRFEELEESKEIVEINKNTDFMLSTKSNEILAILTIIFTHSIPTTLSSPYYGFLNKRVRYAIESAIARYPSILIKLAIVEATNG